MSEFKNNVENIFLPLEKMSNGCFIANLKYNECHVPRFKFAVTYRSITAIYTFMLT